MNRQSPHPAEDSPARRHPLQHLQTPLSASSLPQCHYPIAALSPLVANFESPAAEESKNDDENNTYYHNNKRSSKTTPSLVCKRWTDQQNMSPPNKSNKSGVSDKENIQYQYSPHLQNIKSKLIQNRKLRNDNILSMQSRLSRYSQDDDGSSIYLSREREDMSKTNGIYRNLSNTTMNGKRERSNANTEEGKDITKRYKIDLAPRIAVNNKHTNAPINVVRFQTPGTTADSIVSKALLTARSQMRHDAVQQQQQQEQSTLKTRQDKRTQQCLHNALQIMYSKSYDSSSTSSCADGGGATNVDNNKCVDGSSNVSSLAATTLLDDPYFKQIQTKLNSFKSRRKLISDACDNILEDSTKRSEATSGVSHNWLKVVQDSKDKLDTCSSTFSVSPITKESSIVCESSQLGSLQVDKCTELKKDREDQSTCNQQAAKPSPARTVKTLPTVGSYIGSVEIDSGGNEQRKQTLPTADNVCIDRVGSEMTTSNELRKDRLVDSPIPCVKSSPMPSVANSFAQSMTTNATGDDSDEDTNVFDMLRTTFNNNESDTLEENEEEKEVQLNVTPHRPRLTPMSSRPPLSPKPPMNSAKQISKMVSKSQQQTSTSRRTTPKTLPKIYRGTPNSSMMSGDSILDSSVGDATQDTSHDSTCQQQLEYSFLASALVATSMLATPIKESDDASESIQSYCSSPAVAKSNAMHIPNAPQHSPLPPVPTTTASKRSHQELNYSSTGATLSSNKDPLSLTFDGATDTSFDEDKPRKKHRTPTQSYNEDFDRKVKPSVKLTEDDDTPVDSTKSDEQENALSKLESRIKVLEENQMMPNREIAQLKEKQSILESRLDEEMTLKEEAAEEIIALKSAQDMHKVNEDSLRQKVQELEADLESERAKAVKDLKEQLKIASQEGKKANNERIVELQQTITELTSRRHMLENELVSCGKENDHLRKRVLKLTDDKSIKEYTIATAYNQLKSLSENYYLTKAALKDEREATKNQKNEVSSLQTTLHQMAKKMNALEVENEELKRQLYSTRFMPFCRGSTK